MGVTQRTTTPVLQVVATVWAGALMLCGLATLWGAGSWTPIPGDSAAAPMRSAFGVTALIAAQIVFLCFVADRMFPKADRRVVLGVEIGAFVLLVVAVLWAASRIVAIAAGVME